MLQRFIANADDKTRVALLERLNSESLSEFKRVGNFVSHAGNLRLKEFSQRTLDRLIQKGDEYPFAATLLGKTASEEFAKSVLMVDLVAHPKHTWVEEALRIAGQRHNRRYLIPKAQ